MAYAEQDLMDRLRGFDPYEMTCDQEVCAGNESRGLAEISAKEIFFELRAQQVAEPALARSRFFLTQQLASVADTSSDLPPDINDLPRWMESNSAAVGRQYHQYLAERRSGGPRRYFPAKSHALHFLKAVAPTKLVDGAWLYGLVSQWRDPRYAELIRIYLEELGEGDPNKNHVLLYRNLLATHECEHWENLSEPYFIQGAIQLSLAQHARWYLPEVIGFNLGYEQLPLHLLICAYELNELGIDPYYFILHVTVDNASSGHAARAVRSVMDAMPRLGDKEDFYQRVRNGYQLNSLGASTNQVIATFDLEQELLGILRAKAAVGTQLHSDYCRIAGKTVNEWLSEPAKIKGFLEALQSNGWIRRNETPENSRYWKLLEGEKAPMFGVFSGYERQVIHDWIAGDTLKDLPRTASFRAKERMLNASHGDGDNQHWSETDDDFSSEIQLLQDSVSKARSKSAAMDLLVPWLSPVHHHTPVGLAATQLFSQRLRT